MQKFYTAAGTDGMNKFHLSKSGEDYDFFAPGLSISKNCPVVALEYALWNGVVIDISYRVSQKNVLVHRMLLEPWCAAIIAIGWHHLGLESVFWSFLTKTKQDQALPSHVHGKI